MMGEVGGVLAEVFVCLSLLHCHSNYIHSCSSGALLIRLPADPVHCTGNCLRLGKGCYRCSRSTTREPAHAAMELLVGDICPGRLLSFKPSATSAPYKTSSINVRYVSHTWSYLLCFFSSSWICLLIVFYVFAFLWHQVNLRWSIYQTRIEGQTFRDLSCGDWKCTFVDT